MTRHRFSAETLVMNGLLLLVPATLLAARFNLPPWVPFSLAVGAVIPLAAYIGWATEALADHLGGKVGGLLNATFGNAPDLLVGVFGPVDISILALLVIRPPSSARTALVFYALPVALFGR